MADLGGQLVEVVPLGERAGGVAVLVGPDSPDSAGSLWRRAGDRLAAVLDASDAYVVADVGLGHRPTHRGGRGGHGGGAQIDGAPEQGRAPRT